MRYALVTVAAVVLAAGAFLAVRLGAGGPPVQTPSSATTAPQRDEAYPGDVTSPIEQLIRETREHPDDASAHVELGRLYLKLGRVTGARTSFERAVRLAPGSVAALYGVAACCERETDHAGALRAYLRIATLRVDEPGLKDRIGAARAALSNTPKAP